MLRDVLECPRCRASLHAGGDALVCTACAQTYPRLGRIPLLVAEPASLLARFGALTHEFDAGMSRGLVELLAQIRAADRPTLTQRRLETLHRQLERHWRRILGLVADAGLEPAADEAQNTASPASKAGLLHYYPQIHRDWGWSGENDEAADAQRAVSEVVAERPLGKLLVLGAGACRLTQDLHHRHGATLTVALDLNPLPFFVAERLLRGESLSLFEFPAWPLDSSHPCLERQLASPWPADPRIQLLFADGLNPPVRRGAFDTVLTPWFIDHVPSNMRTLFARLWDLLPVGGRWLNFGPLIYREEHTPLEHRYCVDEVLELVREAGFRIERHSFRRMEYMQSPISTQGRTETVLTFSAERLAG
jgi:hypothetical protein